MENWLKYLNTSNTKTCTGCIWWETSQLLTHYRQICKILWYSVSLPHCFQFHNKWYHRGVRSCVLTMQQELGSASLTYSSLWSLRFRLNFHRLQISEITILDEAVALRVFSRITVATFPICTCEHISKDAIKKSTNLTQTMLIFPSCCVSNHWNSNIKKGSA